MINDKIQSILFTITR